MTESDSQPDCERHAAYLQAYALFESVQGEDFRAAANAVAAAAERADAADWPDVRFILHAAEAVHQLARNPGAVATEDTIGELVARAELTQEPSFVAIALGLRALAASTRGDSSALLGDASRAVALLDNEILPPISRCLAYLVAAAAFNTLSLWELVDELYEQALRLDAASEEALQTDAVAVNRVLIRLEWALTLLENGETAGAERQLAQVLDAVPAALARPLRPLWRGNVLAACDIVRLLAAAPADLGQTVVEVHDSMGAYYQDLVDGGDLETVPLLDAALALVRSRTGVRAPDSQGLDSPQSFASGARSFPLWVRAEVLAADQLPEVMRAQRDYAQVVSRMRWQSRAAVLAAARSHISVERRKADHDRLHYAVQTDTLTGLQNRRVFDLWLRSGADDPGGGQTALLLIDLDGFKTINDTFGHHCGDEVLRRVGRLMRELSRADDLAIRHGGDEFALILRDNQLVENAAAARAVRLATAIAEEPWGSLSTGLSVSASIGLACSAIRPGLHDQHGVLLDAERLYVAADNALYQSKRSGQAVTVATSV